MRPCPCPEDLALYAGEDHPRPEEIAAHVSVCPSCAELVEELRCDRELLREFDVSDVSLELVRERVLAEVAAPRRNFWVAGGLAAAGVAAAMAMWTLRVPPPPVNPAPAPPAVVAVLPPAPAPRKRAVKRKYDDLLVRMDALMKPEPLPPVEGIMLPTADPNVTILLVEEKTGDEE